MALARGKGRLHALYSGLSRRSRRERLVMVFQARTDYSRHGAVAVIAGYVATEEAWGAFSEEWQACLDDERLAQFKMSDMAKSGARRKRCEGFYRVVERHVHCALSVVVDVDALCKALDDCQPPAGIKNWNKLKNPFYEGFRHLWQGVARMQDFLGIHEPVDFVFDEQTEQANIRDGWNRMYLSVSPDMRAKLGRLPYPLNDAEDLPLQSADMWAWLVRRWFALGSDKGIRTLDFRSLNFAWDAKRNIRRMNVVVNEAVIKSELAHVCANAEKFKPLANLPPAEVEAMVVALRKRSS